MLAVLLLSHHGFSRGGDRLQRHEDGWRKSFTAQIRRVCPQMSLTAEGHEHIYWLYWFTVKPASSLGGRCSVERFGYTAEHKNAEEWKAKERR